MNVVMVVMEIDNLVIKKQFLEMRGHVVGSDCISVVMYMYQID